MISLLLIFVTVIAVTDVRDRKTHMLRRQFFFLVALWWISESNPALVLLTSLWNPWVSTFVTKRAVLFLRGTELKSFPTTAVMCTVHQPKVWWAAWIHLMRISDALWPWYISLSGPGHQFYALLRERGSCVDSSTNQPLHWQLNRTSSVKPVLRSQATPSR